MATIPAGMSFPTALLRLAEDSLTFTWDAGDVTPVAHPHCTGWRRLPSLVTAHTLNYHFNIELEGESILGKPGNCLCIAEDVRHCITLVPPNSGISSWSHARFRILGSVDPLRTLIIPAVITGPTATAIGDVNEALVPLAQPRNLAEVARRQALVSALWSWSPDADSRVQKVLNCCVPQNDSRLFCRRWNRIWAMTDLICRVWHASRDYRHHDFTPYSAPHSGSHQHVGSKSVA